MLESRFFQPHHQLFINGHEIAVAPRAQLRGKSSTYIYTGRQDAQNFIPVYILGPVWRGAALDFSEAKTSCVVIWQLRDKKLLCSLEQSACCLPSALFNYNLGGWIRIFYLKNFWFCLMIIIFWISSICLYILHKSQALASTTMFHPTQNALLTYAAAAAIGLRVVNSINSI